MSIIKKSLRIFTDVAEARGIAVELLDCKYWLLRLKQGEKSVLLYETLPSVTPATSYFQTGNKFITSRLLKRNGFSVPESIILPLRVDDAERLQMATDFLETYNSVVVKPADAEAGAGISVDVRSEEGLKRAIHTAEHVSEKVIIEQYVEGEDYRILVIDYKVAGAVKRMRPFIVGNGKHSVKWLIEDYNTQREAETGGPNVVPFDDITKRTLRKQGYDYDDTPDEGERLILRKTANISTGGTFSDVTAELPNHLIDEAENIAKLLEMPLIGIDYLTKDIKNGPYYVIELNERPGLDNHHPQPVGEKFIEMLFPEKNK